MRFATTVSPPHVTPAREKGRRTGCWAAAGLAALYVALAVVAVEQNARDERVLAALDPVIEALRVSGLAALKWLDAHRAVVGLAIGAVGLALVGVGVWRAGRRAAPAVVAVLSLGAIAWGEVALLEEYAASGTLLYAAGMLGALALGIRFPMERLPGFPRLPTVGSGSEARPAAKRGANEVGEVPARLSRRAELGFFFLIAGAGMLARAYALNQLPDFFDGEMTVSMLSSRTVAGLLNYLPWGMHGNSTGLFHLLPQMAMFNVLGASALSLRLVALLQGSAAIPLLYWLARRLAGVGPALAATALFAFAPEQLYWSRSEDCHFSPIALEALIAAHLGLWMVERFSPAAVAAAALWMPVCRFFYAAGLVMFIYPILVYAHAAVFVRRAWRTAYYVVPILSGGFVLWLAAFPGLYAAVSDTPFRLVDRSVLGYFRLVKSGGSSTVAAGVPVDTIVERGRQLAGAMTVRAGFSHWYRRGGSSGALTMINVGRTVLLAFGLAYLLGQLHTRRAGLLLVWVGLSLAPGMLSNDVAARRISLVFPAIDIIAGIAAAAIVRVARLRGGALMGRLSAMALGAGVGAIVWASAVSHFLLPIGPLVFESRFRFTRPLFESSDVIFHNLDETMAMLQVFGSVERFLQPGGTPGYQYVPPNKWLDVALRPQCTFDEAAYRATLPRERVEALRESYNPRRVSFLLYDQPATQREIELLRALFPHVPLLTEGSGEEEAKLASLTVDIADIEALHAPALIAGGLAGNPAALRTRLIEGVALRLSAAAGEAVPERGALIRGGVQLAADGWYRFQLEPACGGADLAIDGQPVRPTDPARPMLAGVHDFAVSITDVSLCEAPAVLSMQSGDGTEEAIRVPPDRIVSPAVAALPSARAPAVRQYDGYGEAVRVPCPEEAIIDFAVDAEGLLVLLTQDRQVFRVRRMTPQGTILATWEPGLPPEKPPVRLSVAADGAVFIVSHHLLAVYDREGRRLSTWKDPPLTTTELLPLADGTVLTAHPPRGGMLALDRSGNVVREWTEFDGGAFSIPRVAAMGPDGQLLIVEASGRAILFRTPADVFAPMFEREFAVRFAGDASYPRGMTFAGEGAILLPDTDGGRVLVYDGQGHDMMAADPARDLNTRGFTEVTRIVAAEDRIYLLNRPGELWSLGVAD